MPQENLLKNWSPPKLIRSLIAMDYAEFERRFGRTVFLLIKLQGLPPALLEDLAFTWGPDSISLDKPADDLGFYTHTVQTAEGRTDGLNRDPVPRISIRVALPPDLYTQPCFLVPIQKREGADSFLNTVTVGRTRNHDIVLRHNSVSKFHASFCFDDDRNVSIKDAGSKNKTWLRGQPITEQTPVRSGDLLRFGSVESIVCDTGTLWSTIQNA